MSDRADELAASVTKIFGKRKKPIDRSFLEHFLENFGKESSEDLEAFLPPLQMLKGMVNKDVKEFGKGLGYSVGSGVAGVALPKLIKAGIAGEKKLTGKLLDKLPSLDKDIVVDATVANMGAKVKIEPRKFGKATRLIEESGGTELKVAKDGKAIWLDSKGNKQTADLTQRFGPRNLNMSDRQRGLNPRAEDADDIVEGFTDNLITKKADKDDIVSRVSEASGVDRGKMKEFGKQRRLEDIADDELDDFTDDLPSLTAADSTGASIEEVSRAGSFYKIGKHGEPTYLSKAVDAGTLGPDEAIIHVIKGKEPTIYQGSGPQSALNRFKKTRTGAEFYTYSSNAGPKPKAMNPRQILTASEIPNVNTSRYSNMLTDKLGKRTINFPSEFDKVAYNLALSKIPNKKILADVLKQVQKTNPNITADTILQHGEKVKLRVNGNTGKGRIILPARSVQVIGPTKDASLKRQIIGLPSEYLFSGDTPHLRQLLRPVLTHPIKTGLPSIKRSFKAITEKGYRAQKEKMVDEEPLLDLLDTMTALGPAKSKKLYPHGKEFKSLGSFDTYDYFGTGNLGEKVPVAGHLPRASRRMFEIAMDSARATEANRMAGKLGMSIEDLAKKGNSELPSLRRSVLEHTGHGPLGPFEQAGELLSTLFTAPRNTMANIQTFNPLNYLPESALPKFITKHGLGGRYGTNFKSKIYQDNLIDTGKMAAGYGGLELADKLLGNDEHISFNPLDTNFGANFGNYRPDIFGSSKGIATLLPQLLQPLMRGGAKALDENVGTDLEDTFTGVNAKGEDMNFSPMEVLNKFARYRIRPGLPSIGGDLTLGYNDRKGEPGDEIGTFTNAIGEDIFKPYSEDAPIMNVPGLASLAELPGSREIGNQFTTSWPKNVYDAFKVGGIPQGIAATLLGGLGSGSATFDPFAQENEEYRPPYKDIMIPKRPKKRQTLGTGIR